MNRIYGVICGMSGMGKTYLNQNYVTKQLAKEKPVIVLDIMNEYDGIQYNSFKDFAGKLADQKFQLSRAVHVIKWKQSIDAIKTIGFVRAMETPLSLVIEEGHVLFTDPDLYKKIKQPLKELTMFGRHYGVDMILSTQRPGNLTADVRSQAQFFTFFCLKDRADLDYTRTIAPDHMDTIASLEKREFITVGTVPELLNKLDSQTVTTL